MNEKVASKASMNPLAWYVSIFRYRADVVPITLFASYFLVDVLFYFVISSPWLMILWFLAGIGPKVAICSWNHHHQHVHTFRSTFYNRIIELVYTFQTGITTNVWVLHHNLGHHVNYLDQAKDESGWKRRDGSTMGEYEYTIRLAVSGYFYAWKVSKKHPKYRAGLITTGTIALLITAAALWYSWFNALFIFVFPMVVGYVATCWHTYFHHADLDSDDHFEASYNIMHKTYNMLTGNLGYHTAHHVKQGLHWSKLPEFHETIKDKIPAHLYRNPKPPVAWMPS